MFALEMEFLMGRILAASREDRRVVEWPPHPSRLFSALVAAYEECELGSESRKALEWLEALPPPALYADPPIHDGQGRDVREVFVPVNDATSTTLSILPKLRGRQGRWFPAFTPRDRHVWFIWEKADGNEQHTRALQHIAENVTYYGHSMSPVRVHVWHPRTEPPKPSLVPQQTGSLMLRTTGKGRLEHLEAVYKARTENATIQPRFGRVTAYRLTENENVIPASLFRHGYIFRYVTGTKLPLESTAGLITAIRRAVIERYPDPVPEIICGHNENGVMTDAPHISITPLADVGHRFADGHIMGFSLLLPSTTPDEVLQNFEDAIAGFRKLKLGEAGIWQIEAVDAAYAARVTALRLRTYEKPSTTWASVTPVIFGKFPKRSQIGPGKNGGKVFAELCEMIGLPNPIEVRMGPVSVLRGTPKAADFIPPTKYKDRLRAHVWVRFPAPVRGPVLLGAARFVGFGLCRPWRDKL